MEIVLTCTISGAFILLAYTLGLKNGQRIVNKEPIELPKNPIEAVKEKQVNKKYEEEIQKLNTIFENIDNYDGTGANQKEV